MKRALKGGTAAGESAAYTRERGRRMSAASEPQFISRTDPEGSLAIACC